MLSNKNFAWCPSERQVHVVNEFSVMGYQVAAGVIFMKIAAWRRDANGQLPDFSHWMSFCLDP
jgi:hypothetical protein